jgi:hypothetical protein
MCNLRTPLQEYRGREILWLRLAFLLTPHVPEYPGRRNVSIEWLRALCSGELQWWVAALRAGQEPPLSFRLSFAIPRAKKKRDVAAEQRALAAFEEGADWKVVAALNGVSKTTAWRIIKRGTVAHKLCGGVREKLTKVTSEIVEALF